MVGLVGNASSITGLVRLEPDQPSDEHLLAPTMPLCVQLQQRLSSKSSAQTILSAQRSERSPATHFQEDENLELWSEAFVRGFCQVKAVHASSGSLLGRVPSCGSERLASTPEKACRSIEHPEGWCFDVPERLPSPALLGPVLGVSVATCLHKAQELAVGNLVLGYPGGGEKHNGDHADVCFAQCHHRIHSLQTRQATW